MGPFYWVLAELHVPLWVAQRLWMACLLYAAGAGALYLCRVVGLSGAGRYVAALGYMFTPYVLQYAGRISVILMPWSGLPWMLAFVILALRKGGWRYPALFALVVALVSGINASSILYVGIAPALWLPYAVLVAKEATWRKAWGVAWRVGGLTALVSLWWAVGLQVEAAYGVNVLKYTETVPATSAASLASEILRGLGYWYFYGTDRVGPWTQNSIAYTQNIRLIALSFTVPVLAFLAAFIARWRYRSYFLLVTVVGMVLAVGPNPYAHTSGVGAVIKAFMVDTTAGPGPALDRPRLPGGPPRPGHVPRRGGQRAHLPGAAYRPGHRSLRRRGGRRGHDTPVDRADRGGRVHPAGGAPAVRAPGGRNARQVPSRDPGLRPARQRLRRLPVGRHHRHRLPGTDDPAVRDPRAADHGIPADGRRARGGRRSPPGRDHGLEHARADGVADERRRRARPVRPGLRTLRHARPAVGGRAAGHHPGRALRPRVLRHPASERAPAPPRRRGVPGPPAQRGLALAARLVHRRRPPTHRPDRVDHRSPGRGR